MGQQRTLASLAWQTKGKTTRRERFLAEMDAVIPWAALLAHIEPHYPKAGKGRQPVGLERMLRIYFLQQWFNLSDSQADGTKKHPLTPNQKLINRSRSRTRARGEHPFHGV